MATELNGMNLAVPTKSHTPSRLDKWHVNPSLNREYDFIDGLRGIAILMVIIGHHFYTNPISGSVERFFGGMISTGGYGVTLFFALSGFLISWPFWKRKVNQSEISIPLGYGWRRFWKIYPPLALSIILLTPAYILITHDKSYLTTAAQWLCGIAFFMPVSGKLNPVMWSLVVEVQFYFLLPLIFLLSKRIPAKTSLWIITIIFLLAPICTHAVFGFSPAFYPKIDSFFPSGLDSFYFGILIAGLENMRLLKTSVAWLGDLGLVFLLIIVFSGGWLSLHNKLNGGGHYMMEWLTKISAGCMLCYVANPQNPRAKLLCTPWLRWCGIISYEWYLFHQPISLWARQIYGPANGNLFKYALITGIPLFVGLLFSALVYRCFSLPILKYGRGKH